MRLILLCFLVLLITVVLLQTPFAKNKLQKWIETKTEGTLKVGKIEGLIPFWIRLRDVAYQKETEHVNADKVDVFLSPTTFFFGELSIIRLNINKVDIQTAANSASPAWPAAPLPVSAHSMKINSLTINQLEEISVTGMGEIFQDFSLHLAISYEDYLFRLGLEGDAEEQTVGIVLHTQQEQDLNMWISGIYDWEDTTFTGEIYGEVFSWNVKSTLSFTDSLLIFSNASVRRDSLFASGQIAYNFLARSFHSEGNLLGYPFFGAGKIEWTEGAIHLSDFSLHDTKNTLTGSLNYHQASLTGELDLKLNDLSPYPIEHPIEGTGWGHLSIQPEQTAFTLAGNHIQWKDLTFSEMKLEGKIRESRLTYSLNVQDFIVLDPAYEVFPTAHLNLNGEATKEKLSLTGEALGLSSTPFTLAAQIPIHFSSQPFDIAIDHEAPFFINLKGRGSIDPILAFLENASLIARGDIDLDLALSGTWDHPQIEGSLTYENGWVESLATGVLYRDIHVVLEGEGRALKICSMIVHDLDRGDLSGVGQIEWNPQKAFPFEFTFFTNQFTLLALDPLTTSVNAQLRVSGNIHEVAITGSAAIVEGHLAIPNKMPTQVPTLEVTYINPLPTPKPEIEEVKKTIPIYWDVQIEIPRRLAIEGRGLISEWRGALHMYGYQDALCYTGKLKLIQGRFTLVGRTFDLVEGKIQIEGLDPKDIFVNLKGDLEVAAITASIRVSGSLDSTHLAFCSNPPMGTNQILSWILFNQDVNELTPFQACRLANVLVQLSGKYAGPSVFNNIKEGLGIDVFDITNCDIDSADLTFQVGKYISQGTFVGVSKSLSGDFDSVLIQTRLYRDFYLEGDYGGSLNGLTPNGGKLIFKWYKTY